MQAAWWRGLWELGSGDELRGQGSEKTPETCYCSGARGSTGGSGLRRLGSASLGLTSFPRGADQKMTGPQRLAPAQQLSEVPRSSPDPTAAGVWAVCVALPTCKMGGGVNNPHRKDRCGGFTCVGGVPGEGRMLGLHTPLTAAAPRKPALTHSGAHGGHIPAGGWMLEDAV